MNYVLKNKSGLYFANGKGFTVNRAQATVLTAEETEEKLLCSASMGIAAFTEEADSTASTSAPAKPQKSYAVCYIRQSDIDETTGAIKANSLNPSRRRFATKAGATKHGSRFAERRSAYGAPKGSAGHVGFRVIETTDPVNSAINLDTGLTVPANGAPKTWSARVSAGKTTQAYYSSKK